MRRHLLLLITMIATTAVFAEDYPYLTFETADGNKTSVSVSSLTLIVKDGKLTAGDKTFNLSELSKMYFSMEEATGIEKVVSSIEGTVEVFNLRGISMGKYNSMNEAAASLKTGVYVIKSKSKTIKVSVK